jgi:beta-lysine 5,6-aminomutase alpha subunit
MVTVITHQRIQLLGMLTEAIHTPFMSDRALAIENARYIATAMADLGAEIEFRDGGLMEQRANEVLSQALDLLQGIRRDGLFRTLEEGKFAGIKRSLQGGKGLSGVIEKARNYVNPFVPLLLKEETDLAKAADGRTAQGGQR